MALFLLWALAFSGVASQEFARTGSGLTEVPSDIPANTTALQLQSNNLANADFAALSGLAVESIDLTDNGFTTFPDLSSVGATLKTIYIRENDISSIDLAVLQNLDVLLTLDLSGNLLTTFPDLSPVGDTLEFLSLHNNPIQTISPSVLAPLTRLFSLRLSRIPMVVSIETFSPLADTLREFSLPSSVNRDAGNFSVFHSLKQLNFLSTQTSIFPILPTDCDTMIYINGARNNLVTIGSALNHCKNIRTLQLYDNALTSIPNITAMGQSLSKLYLSNNRISSFDPAISRALVKLSKVSLDTNELTIFPDLTMSGMTLTSFKIHSNRISNLDQNLVAPLVMLTTLDLHGNRFTSLPDVQQLNQIQHLILYDNPIRFARPQYLASLGRFLTVDLRSTALSVLHTMCPQGPLTLHLEDNAALDLCSPSMAWLKQGSLTVTATDVLCPELGKMWNEAAFEELVIAPTPPRPGTVKELFHGPGLVDSFCSWPTDGALVPATKDECFTACLMRDDCISFSYNHARSLCVIAAPSPSQLTPLMESPSNWTYYSP